MKSLTIINRPSFILSKKGEALLLFCILLMPLFIIALNIRSAVPNIAYCLLFFSGWITWTFIEYYNHRFRMHSNGDHSKIIGYESHMTHHHHPKDIKISGTDRMFLFVGNIALIVLCMYYRNWLLVKYICCRR